MCKSQADSNTPSSPVEPLELRLTTCEEVLTTHAKATWQSSTTNSPFPPSACDRLSDLEPKTWDFHKAHGSGDRGPKLSHEEWEAESMVKHKGVEERRQTLLQKFG